MRLRCHIDAHTDPALEASAREDARREAREERLANNEIIFRKVNEGIQQLAFSHHGGTDYYEFICECTEMSCVDRIDLTPQEYEHIRRDGTHFLVMPGHQNVEVELVVERFAKYVVVEKDGHAGIVAEQADPRDNDTYG